MSFAVDHSLSLGPPPNELCDWVVVDDVLWLVVATEMGNPHSVSFCVFLIIYYVYAATYRKNKLKYCHTIIYWLTTQ